MSKNRFNDQNNGDVVTLDINRDILTDYASPLVSRWSAVIGGTQSLLFWCNAVLSAVHYRTVLLLSCLLTGTIADHKATDHCDINDKA